MADLFDTFLVDSHIVAGFLVMVTGVVPLLTHKGGVNHRRWGKLYVWAMLYMLISAQLVQILYRQSYLVFFAGVLAFYQLFTGYRALELKSRQRDGAPEPGGAPTAARGAQRPWISLFSASPMALNTEGPSVALAGARPLAQAADRQSQPRLRAEWIDWVMIALALVCGLLFIAWASSPFWSAEIAARYRGPRLFSLRLVGIWLGCYTCFWALADVVRFRFPPRDKQWWWYHHLNGMLSSLGSSLVALVAVNSWRVAGNHPEAVWFLWFIPAAGTFVGAFVWEQYYRAKFNKRSLPNIPALTVSGAVRGLSLALVALAFLAGGLSLRAPATAPADAPPTDFSAQRVMQYIPPISRVTHPIGTPEQDQVRAYIAQQLQALGVEHQEQRGTGVVENAVNGSTVAGSAINLVARIPGTQSRFPIVLVAHTDSPPTSFGANDNGVSSGVLLETARAIKAGPPLKNDVILLFSDGEEVGSVGAQAFVREHPWAKGGGVALNFDSRGSAGPSMMYETGDQNGALIGVFAGAPQPFASSLTNEVYRRLPFMTDFTIFKRAGWQGLNFAYLDGYPYYQGSLDTLARVDPQSIQHHGSYALALTRALGNLDAPPQPQPDAIYFDLLQRVLISYPAFLAPALALLALGLFAGVAALGRRRQHLTYRSLGVGALGFLVAVATPALALTLLWQGLLFIHPGYRAILLDVYNNAAYRVAFGALTVALVALIYGWLYRRVALPALALGPLALWVLLAVATSLAMPGASFLFTLPPLALLVALGLLLRRPGPWTQPTPGQAALICLAAAPGILLLFPTAIQLSITLGTAMSGALGFFLALLLGLLVIPLRLISLRFERAVWGLGLAVALAGLLYAGSTASFTAERPYPTNLMYGLDAETNQAFWISESDDLDTWSKSVLDGAEYGPATTFFPAYSGWLPLRRSAPVVAMPAPEVKPLSQSDQDGLRTLRLQVRSPRGAPVMRLSLGETPDIQSIAVNGVPVEDVASGFVGRWWELTYYRVPAEGFTLEVRYKPDAPLQVVAVDRSYGQPAQTNIPPRPPESMAIPFPFSIGDITMVRRAVEFR